MSCSPFPREGVYVHSALLLPTQCSDDSVKGGPGNFHLFQENFKINFILLKKKKTQQILVLPVSNERANKQQKIVTSSSDHVLWHRVRTFKAELICP